MNGSYPRRGETIMSMVVAAWWDRLCCADFAFRASPAERTFSVIRRAPLATRTALTEIVIVAGIVQALAYGTSQSSAPWSGSSPKATAYK